MAARHEHPEQLRLFEPNVASARRGGAPPRYVQQPLFREVRSHRRRSAGGDVTVSAHMRVAGSHVRVRLDDELRPTG